MNSKAYRRRRDILENRIAAAAAHLDRANGPWRKMWRAGYDAANDALVDLVSAYDDELEAAAEDAAVLAYRERFM